MKSNLFKVCLKVKQLMVLSSFLAIAIVGQTSFAQSSRFFNAFDKGAMDRTHRVRFTSMQGSRGTMITTNSIKDGFQTGDRIVAVFDEKIFMAEVIQDRTSYGDSNSSEDSEVSISKLKRIYSDSKEDFESFDKSDVQSNAELKNLTFKFKVVSEFFREDPDIKVVTESVPRSLMSGGSVELYRTYIYTFSEPALDQEAQNQIDSAQKKLVQTANEIAEIKKKAAADLASAIDMVSSVVQSLEAQNVDDGYQFKSDLSDSFTQEIKLTRKTLLHAHPLTARQDKARNAGLGLTEISDESYFNNEKNDAQLYLYMAKEFADIAFGVDEVTTSMRDTYQAIIGLDMITEEELPIFERSLAVFGIMTGGNGSWAKRSIKSLVKLRGMRNATLAVKTPETFSSAVDLVNRSMEHWSLLSHWQVAKNVYYIKTFYKTSDSQFETVVNQMPENIAGIAYIANKSFEDPIDTGLEIGSNGKKFLKELSSFDAPSVWDAWTGIVEASELMAGQVLIYLEKSADDIGDSAEAVFSSVYRSTNGHTDELIADVIANPGLDKATVRITKDRVSVWFGDINGEMGFKFPDSDTLKNTTHKLETIDFKTGSRLVPNLSK